MAVAASGTGCSSRHWHQVAWPDEIAPADSLAALAPGDAVRIETRDGSRLEGTVRRVEAGAVVVTEAGGLKQDVTVPRPAVARIERAESEPWSTEKTVAVFGLGALVLAGAVAGAMAIWGTPGLGN